MGTTDAGLPNAGLPDVRGRSETESAVTHPETGGTDRRVIVADEVALHVRTWPGNRRPFLLVHGLSSNARLWDPVAARLAAAGHPVTAVDLRSHGESDAPPGGYDTATAAAGPRRAPDTGRGSWPASPGAATWRSSSPPSTPKLVAGLALVDGGWIAPAEEFPSWEACEAALRPPKIDGLAASQLEGFIRSGHPGWSDAAVAATLPTFGCGPTARWPGGCRSSGTCRSCAACGTTRRSPTIPRYPYLCCSSRHPRRPARLRAAPGPHPGRRRRPA